MATIRDRHALPPSITAQTALAAGLLVDSSRLLTRIPRTAAYTDTDTNDYADRYSAYGSINEARSIIHPFIEEMELGSSSDLEFLLAEPENVVFRENIFGSRPGAIEVREARDEVISVNTEEAAQVRKRRLVHRLSEGVVGVGRKMKGRVKSIFSRKDSGLGEGVDAADAEAEGIAVDGRISTLSRQSSGIYSSRQGSGNALLSPLPSAVCARGLSTCSSDALLNGSMSGQLSSPPTQLSYAGNSKPSHQRGEDGQCISRFQTNATPQRHDDALAIMGPLKRYPPRYQEDVWRMERLVLAVTRAQIQGRFDDAERDRHFANAPGNKYPCPIRRAKASESLNKEFREVAHRRMRRYECIMADHEKRERKSHQSCSRGPSKPSMWSLSRQAKKVDASLGRRQTVSSTVLSHGAAKSRNVEAVSGVVGRALQRSQTMYP